MKWIDELRGIVGAERVLTGRDAVEPFSHDETEDLRFYPEVVVEPETAGEVQAILRLASREGLPVTPRAGGTGLSGGALPVRGGILLSVRRMNRIVEIDTANLFAVVEPGVITQALQEEVEKVGLFYPPDPASRGSCMIGGNVAENAGGPRALKYGVTKDYVYGLDVVMANGDLLRYGGKLLKDRGGYNMTQVFVGSEGTLGVVTRAILKLLPLPRLRRTLLAPFPDVESAARTVPAIFMRGIVPCACEYMERAAVKAAERHRGTTFPHSDAEALLLFEVDGNDAGLLDRQAAAIGEVCVENGAPDLLVADDPAKQESVWGIRRSLGEAVKSLAPYKEEDTVVPRASLPKLVRAVREVAGAYGITAIAYGHVGDGNLHVNLLKTGAITDGRFDEAIRELFRRVVALGGQISGEHGIGYVQRSYLPIACSPEEIAWMRALKRAFDPDGILNPDKLLPP